jgi:hypothetical protein
MPGRQFCSSNLLLRLLSADNYFTCVAFIRGSGLQSDGLGQLVV